MNGWMNKSFCVSGSGKHFTSLAARITKITWNISSSPPKTSNVYVSRKPINRSRIYAQQFFLFMFDMTKPLKRLLQLLHLSFYNPFSISNACISGTLSLKASIQHLTSLSKVCLVSEGKQCPFSSIFFQLNHPQQHKMWVQSKRCNNWGCPRTCRGTAHLRLNWNAQRSRKAHGDWKCFRCI